MKNKKLISIIVVAGFFGVVALSLVLYFFHEGMGAGVFSVISSSSEQEQGVASVAVLDQDANSDSDSAAPAAEQSTPPPEPQPQAQPLPPVPTASPTMPVEQMPVSSSVATSVPPPVASQTTPVVVMPPTSAPVSSTPANSDLQYIITISSFGGGSGTVSSSPLGISCGFTCEAKFSSGSELTFVATPEPGSVFKGWSGPCATGGDGMCSFVVSSSVAIAAEFDPIETSSSESETVVSSETPPPTSTSAPAPSIDHMLIAQIQIAGGVSSNDFVKLYNPTGASIDMSGWKLHKKSSTGTDYSLRTFPSGSVVASGGYFTWANSEDGFSESIGADVSSTETLSAENSVALFDANGDIVDQVAWGTGTNQYVEGDAYPTDPIVGQVLERKVESGAFVDTDDNSSDFVIQ